MTVDIVPAILAATKEEFDDKLRIVEGQVPLVQIDVADHSFTPHQSYAVPEDVEVIRPTFDVDVHLMTTAVEETVLHWVRSWVGKITVHVEAAKDVLSALGLIHAHKISAALALNPATPTERLEPYLGAIESVLFLGVPPGAGGQTFDERVLEKIRAFHAAHPETIIGIDGGVTKELIPQLIEAGASTIVIGSSLFKAEDPIAELQELEELVEEKGDNQ